MTGVRLGSAGFRTDRGRAQVTAWLLSTPDGRDELAYPAVDPDWLFLPAPLQGHHSHLGFAVAGRDGRPLTLAVQLRAGNQCDPGERYGGLLVAESASAVMVTVRATTPPDWTRPPEGTLCSLALAVRVTKVVVALAHPLGPRVLVDETGGPVTVCPASTASRTWGSC